MRLKENESLTLQPNLYSCLPCCIANFLRIDIQEIFDHCGHDGSKLKGFTCSEMVIFCLSRRKYLMIYSPFTVEGSNYNPGAFFADILIGETNRGDHCYLSTSKGIWDPNIGFIDPASLQNVKWHGIIR